MAAVVPNLLTYPGSVICIDPKGENAAVTARARREMGQEVHILDPWHITGQRGSAFNPLSWLQTGSLDLVDDAAVIADALVSDRATAEAAHWVNEAKGLLTGLILHVAESEPAARRTLARVRDLLCADYDGWKNLLDRMAESDGAFGLVARAAARMDQKSDRERSGVISTAQSNTNFLDSPRMGAAMDGSDFRLESLKRRPTTLYLVIPSERIITHGRWLRLMVALSLATMARTQGAPERPVLFLLDEFAALGRLEPVENAVGLLAGYGVQLWPIVQDFSQLTDLYGQRWVSFFSNAGVVQAFGVSESMTARELSARLGRRTVTVRHDTASPNGPGGRRVTLAYGATARDLLTPDEIMRLDGGKELLLLRGQKPILADKVRYYADAEFKGLFDPNPMLQPPPAPVFVAPMERSEQAALSAVRPPPAETILWFAVRAWAVEQDVPIIGDDPALLPDPVLWQPAVSKILHSDNWSARMQAYAVQGLRYCKATGDQIDCIPEAFATPGFRAALIKAMEHLATRTRRR